MLFKKIKLKITSFVGMLLMMGVAQAHPGHHHSDIEPILTILGYSVLVVVFFVVLWFSYKLYRNEGEA